MLRLYDASDGCVRVDGVDVRDLTLHRLRGAVGIVTQDVQLFEATLRDNLTLFAEHADDARLVSVLEQLDLGSWLARLPAGLDTLIGGAGVGLSAGEAQLLAFGRVFLRDPGVVILDEASSRLDPATEQPHRAAPSTGSSSAAPRSSSPTGSRRCNAPTTCSCSITVGSPSTAPVPTSMADASSHFAGLVELGSRGSAS